ncbi:MAG: TIGR03752 family integrating conjugative element protein [Pseudoxanthomonas sp.]|nr:TIGR03752 family integrating conjugative element protein [Pseudoxanthomonas sp.]
MATSNRLIPILGIAGVAIVGTIMVKQCGSSTHKAGAPMTSVPAPALPEATGADNDTPAETLKTVAASNNQLRKDIADVIKRNDALVEENRRLRGTPGAAATAAAQTPAAAATPTAPAATAPQEPQSTLERALDTAGRAAEAVASGFPNTGMKRAPETASTPTSTAQTTHTATTAAAGSAAAEDAPHGTVHYSLMAPMGYAIQTEQVPGRQGGQSVPITRFVRTTLPSDTANTVPGHGPAAQAARAAQAGGGKPEDTPYFTIPENATLVGATAMTSLIGRVPIDGRVTDPMQFKAVIGRDNLAANSFELPADIAGMIVTGIAIGDMALSCIEGRVRSMTFVFNDGSIRTVSTRRRGGTGVTGGAQGGFGASGAGGNDLGFVSDEHGNPCITGTFVTNAPAYLTDIVGLKSLGVAGQAFAQAQTMTRANMDGSMTGAVTGNAGTFALGQAVSGATDEVTKWMLQRLKNSFDAVITPSGKKLVVHLDQEIRIDKEVKARKLVYRQQDSRQIARGERYGLE